MKIITNLLKKWIFRAQFHFQDSYPDSEYGYGSSYETLVPNKANLSKFFSVAQQDDDPVVVLCDTCDQSFAGEAEAVAHIQHLHTHITLKGTGTRTVH